MFFKGISKPITYESIYSNDFINTDFFKFYNNLINSQKLLDAMKKYNYTGIFCLHPSFSEQWRDFKNNSMFSINEKCDYKSLLTKTSLLITDYSSVFFDFAYMQKPIIYTQFDFEVYRKNHYKAGYFNYNLNGFGPVCFDLETCIDYIIAQIKGKCKIEKKYLKRIKKFFAFFDRNNNDRIYNAIKNESFEKIDKFQSKINIFIIIIIIIKILTHKKYKRNTLYKNSIFRSIL